MKATVDTFDRIAEVLVDLEQRQFERIKAAFRWPDELKSHIRGSIQTYAVDGPSNGLALPAVCVVGVNYTQNGRAAIGKLFPYEEGSVGVVRPTSSKAAVVSVIAAYDRNATAWTSAAPDKP